MKELLSPQKPPQPVVIVTRGHGITSSADDPPITRTAARNPRKRSFEIRFDGAGGYFYLCMADRAESRRIERHSGPFGGSVLVLKHLYICRPYRGAGLGRTTLARILAATDALGAHVCLYARPYDDKPLALDALTGMYKRAGFEQLCVIRSGPWKGDPFMFRRSR